MRSSRALFPLFFTMWGHSEKTAVRLRGLAQVLKQLSSKHEALGSIPSMDPRGGDDSCLWTKKLDFPKTLPCRHPDLRPPASRNLRNKLLLFTSHPVYGNLYSSLSRLKHIVHSKYSDTCGWYTVVSHCIPMNEIQGWQL
jgi:hypothetical protein